LAATQGFLVASYHSIFLDSWQSETSRLKVDADFANMLTAGHVIKSINHPIAGEIEISFDGECQIVAAKEANRVFQHFPGPDHDAANVSAFAQSKNGNIRHLLLGGNGQKSNNGDNSTIRDRVKGLFDSAGAAIFENEG
jgi:hypothetical protein